MTRADILAKLKAIEPALRARGVAALYLFGSYARDEAREGSDIDVFVEPETEQFYALANFAGAFTDIQKAIPDCEIDYGTRGGLSKYIRSTVEREAVRVF